MLKVSRILLAATNKVWVSPEGRVLPVPANMEHASMAREILGPDWDPDYQEDAFIELLQRGWIRIGAALNQTYIMVMRLGQTQLRQAQTVVMKHPELQRSRVHLEQYEVAGGRNLCFFGSMDEFLNLRSPGEAWRSRVASRGLMGVNINDSQYPWTEWILNGEKTIETRDSNSLKAHVGERVGIIQTGRGPATLVGYMVLGEPIVYQTDEEFQKDHARHKVPWHLEPGKVKYGYPIERVEAVAPKPVTSQGRVFRRLD